MVWQELEKKNEFTTQGCFLPELTFTDLKSHACDADQKKLAELVTKRAKRWRSSAFMLLRNPPHVFGTGYAQKLAEEMTDDLYRIRLMAILDAISDPGKTKIVGLVTKGVSYGTYGVTVTAPATLLSLSQMREPNFGDFIKFPPIGDLKKIGALWVREECVSHGATTMGADCKLDGISRDLIVRPLQWKGIASDERNFVRDALNFHFGVQDSEIRGGNKDPSKNDPDQDKRPNEISIAQVSALTAFTMSLRPPQMVWPSDPKMKKEAEAGRDLFMGNGFQDNTSCVSCHRNTLMLSDTHVTVRDPRLDKTYLVTPAQSLSAQVVYENDAAPPALQSIVRGALEAYQEHKMESKSKDELIQRMRDYLAGVRSTTLASSSTSVSHQKRQRKNLSLTPILACRR